MFFRQVILPVARCVMLGLPLATAAAPLVAEEAPSASRGPLIERFGPVYEVAEPGFATPRQLDYKAVFDVGPSPEDPATLNPRIESLARFLNMHARAGVKPANMHLALVLHGPAGKDALSSPAYKLRFGVDNPNAALLEALRAQGVEIILCGQTAVHKGFRPEEIAPSVATSLSAMTALVALQAQGYGLIAF